MLQPASFRRPFIVGAVGFENISVTPCETFTAEVGARRCLMIKSSSLIIDLIGWLVDVVVAAVVVVIVRFVVVTDAASSKALFRWSKSLIKLVKFDEIFLKSGITSPFCFTSSDSKVWFMWEDKVFSVKVTFDLCSWVVGAVASEKRERKKSEIYTFSLRFDGEVRTRRSFYQEAFVRIHYFWVAIHWLLWTLHRCSP